MLSHQIKSFHGFSFVEKAKLIFSIPIRKLISKQAEELIIARGILYRIVEKGGEVNKLDNCIQVCTTCISSKPIKFLLRKNSTDLSIFSEIIVNKGGGYKMVPVIAKKNNIRINTIIDAGANVGCATVFFRENYPESKIISIEPDNGNFEMLNRNIRINNYNDIWVLRNAFWKNNEELNFGIGIRGSREKELSYGISESGSQKVSGVTFPDCLKMLSADTIDLLKIDIEGAEKALIDDLEGFHYMLDHTRILAIELHEEVVNLLDFFELVRNKGFDFIQYGEITICWKKI